MELYILCFSLFEEQMISKMNCYHTLRQATFYRLSELFKSDIQRRFSPSNLELLPAKTKPRALPHLQLSSPLSILHYSNKYKSAISDTLPLSLSLLLVVLETPLTPSPILSCMI